MGVGDLISSGSNIGLDAESGQFDTTAYATALAFNSAALPPGMPEWLVATIEAKATAILQDATNPLIATLSADAKEKQRQDAADNYLQGQIALIAQAQQHERDEWARTSSTIGDVTKTGAEWSAFAHRLREDEPLHQKIVEAFIARGMTRSDAEARYDRVSEIAEIAAIPPAQRTEEQHQKIEAAGSDPKFSRDMQDAVALAKQWKPEAEQRSELNGEFRDAAIGKAAEPPASSPAPIVQPLVVVRDLGL